MTLYPLFKSTLLALIQAAGQRPSDTLGLGEFAQMAQAHLLLEPADSNLHQRLALSAEERAALADNLARFAQHHPAALQGSAKAETQSALAALRALSWFETARRNASSITWPTAEVHPGPDWDAFTRVRALELVLRDLMAEANPASSNLQGQLKTLLSASRYREVVKQSQADPLTRLVFSELASLVVSPDQWPKVGRLFESGHYLSLLSDRRTTVQSYLQDIRRIRNDLAHHRALSKVQVELLALYFDEIIAPLRSAFAGRATQVDPDAYASPPQEALQSYQRQLRDELQTLTQTHREVKSSKRLIIATLAGVAVLLAISVPLLVPVYRQVFDQDRLFEDNVLKSVRLHPSTAAPSLGQYCLLERWSFVERLADVPEVRAAFKGDLAHQAVFSIVRLAQEKPRALERCLPAFKRAGWDPNRPSPVTAGVAYRNAIQNGVAPKAFQAYLNAFQGRTVEGTRLNPQNLQPTALMYAVWQEDVALIKALIAHGADPRAKSTVTLFGVNKSQIVPVIDPVEAAQIGGNASVVAALTAQ